MLVAAGDLVSLRPAEPRVLPTGRQFRPKQLASNPSAGLRRLARPEPVAGLLSVDCSARADRPLATAGQPAAPEAGRFALRKTAARMADLTCFAAPACAHPARLPDRYHAKRTARWREHAQAAEVRRWRSAENQHERAVAAHDSQSVEACRKPVVGPRHSRAVEEAQHSQAVDLRRSLGTPEPAGRYNRLPALQDPRPVERPSNSSARKAAPHSPGRPHNRKVAKQGWRPR